MFKRIMKSLTENVITDQQQHLYNAIPTPLPLQHSKSLRQLFMQHTSVQV